MKRTLKAIQLRFFFLFFSISLCFSYLLSSFSVKAAEIAEAVIDYDIVYVRYPALGLNTDFVVISQGEQAYKIQEGADLMLLHSDGSEIILVDCDKCSVMDPTISFDAKTVYYQYIERENNKYASYLYKIKLDQKPYTPIRLTYNDGFDSNKYVANTTSKHDQSTYRPIRDMSPIPLADGRLLFTSNRSGLTALNSHFTNAARDSSVQQLYVMSDHDGELNTGVLSNVQRLEVGTLHLAQHPIQLKDGRILFSTWQDVATKFRYAMTPLFTVNPDGTDLKQFTEPHDHHKMLEHFITQLSNEDVVTTYYYPSYDYGYGVLFRYPIDPDGPDFLRGNITQRYNWKKNNSFYPQVSYREFDRKGARVITPHSTADDKPSPFGSGKYSMPAATINDEMLVAYSTGYVNYFSAYCAKGETYRCDALKSGIYLMKVRKDLPNGDGNLWVNDPTDNKQLVKIKDDPNYNEIWPKPVVTYQQIYGVDKPEVISNDFNSATLNAGILPGHPTGLVGTSSMYNREPIDESEIGGLYASESREINSGNWRIQGAEAGLVNDNDIYGVRIIGTPPKPYTKPISKYGDTAEYYKEIKKYLNYNPDNFVGQYSSLNGERWEVLGEFPLLHKNTVDKQGNPDTSWVAKIPADTPFLIQAIDENGMTLISELTWRGVKAGEMRTDCGGCHAHSIEDLRFESTMAASGLGIHEDGTPYSEVAVNGVSKGDKRLTNGVWDLTSGSIPLIIQDNDKPSVTFFDGPVLGIEFNRDVKPVLEKNCALACHTINGSFPSLILDGSDGSDIYKNLTHNYDDSGKKITLPQISKYIRTPQARASLLTWVAWGERLDGRKNESVTTDSDYTDEIHNAHLSLNLTDLEKRTIARWIDLGSPIDFPQTDGMGYTDDNQLPVINIAKANIKKHKPAHRVNRFVNTKAVDGRISRQQQSYQSRHVGVIDVHSGINFDKWKAYLVPVEQLANKANFEIKPQRPSRKLNESITDKRLRTYNLVPSQGEATDYIFMVEVEDLVGNRNIASERIRFD